MYDEISWHLSVDSLLIQILCYIMLTEEVKKKSFLFRGNPDKCDFFGSTALHLAATNGRMNCVSFLVSFGANLWALDNDFHTPLDVALLSNHLEIVKHLDLSITQQSALNKKVVAKLKQKAIIETEKRVKKYNKKQDKAQKKAEKEDKKLARKDQERMVGTPRKEIPDANKNGTVKSVRSIKRSLSIGRSTYSETASEPKPYSAHFKSQNHKSMLNGVAKRIKQRRGEDVNNEFKVGERGTDGTRTIRSLSGLQRDHHVIYVSTNDNNSSSDSNNSQQLSELRQKSRSASVPDLTYRDDSGVDSSESFQEPASIFERPGFGSVAFMKRPHIPDHLMSLPKDRDNDLHSGSLGDTEASRREGSVSDSIGTLGSLSRRMKDMPWEDVDSLDDKDSESSELEMFLAANAMPEYLNLLTREKIDLPALMLLSDSDLKEIGLPMGPRRKLIDAIERRRRVLDKPGVIMDTLL